MSLGPYTALSKSGRIDGNQSQIPPRNTLQRSKCLSYYDKDKGKEGVTGRVADSFVFVALGLDFVEAEIDVVLIAGVIEIA